jgi:hypothetical protein
MIIEEIDESLFISRFEDYQMVGENKNFSYKGLRALFEYLEEITDEENPLKLDVIALCCDYVEYKNLEEFLNDYYTTEQINDLIREFKEEDCLKEELTEEEREEFKQKIEEKLNDERTLIKFSDDLDDGFIIATY